MDYQKSFDTLAKRPPQPKKVYWRSFDGKEVEVETRIKNTRVKFRIWNPNTFFFNHDDDKIARNVNAAIEAIIITTGKSAVDF